MPYRQLPDPPLRELDLKVGNRYNWINQAERLVYMGLCEPRNGRWHQFAKVDTPNVVWCEVHPSDLHRIEETLPPPPPPPTVTVIKNGQKEERPVAYIQRETRNNILPIKAVPVLHEGEVMHETVDGTIYVMDGKKP